MSGKRKPPLVILTGPTAVGKTKASIALAKKIHGAIISADSMQVYRGMDIGSAKIKPEEMEGVPHYLIDILDPKESFDVATFVSRAQEALDEIYASGRLPIIAGGTGFYIQALLYCIDFSEGDSDENYRAHLQMLVEQEGPEALFGRLREVDPASCEAIHPHNTKRVIRALEYFHQTNTPISLHNQEQASRVAAYDFRYFVITDDRARIYERIDQRVDAMMEEGLLDEVKRLKEQGLTTKDVSMQGLGYKEILRALDGEISIDEAVYLIKRDTRRFAKRQLTWFRREKEVIWLDKGLLGEEGLVEEMRKHCKEFIINPSLNS